MEYCIQAGRSYYQKDVINLEKIQRRAIGTYQYDGRTERYGKRGTLKSNHAAVLKVFEIIKLLKGLNREDFFEME